MKKFLWTTSIAIAKTGFEMNNAKVIRNLVLLGVLVLCSSWSATSYAKQYSKAPSTEQQSKEMSIPLKSQQTPFFVRGTVMVIYPSQSTGKGVKDIEVSLLQVSETGRVASSVKKTTNSDGRYSFMLLPADKGKRYKIVPRFLQTCCPGCCSMTPAQKEFTLQDSITADFKLYLPAPDMAISLSTMDAGNYLEGTSIEFEIKNKGYLPSSKSKITLSINQPCCPERCVKEKEVPAIPAQGSIKIMITTTINAGARGCPFTATLSPQPYEVKTDDNKVAANSPNLHLPDIQVTSDGNFIYVKNKGVSGTNVDLKWKCICSECAGVARCWCPPLQPVSNAAPVLKAQADCINTSTQRANLTVNGEWIYRIPERTHPGTCFGCVEGRLIVMPSDFTVNEYVPDNNARNIRFK